MGNGEAKELICTIHGHELRWRNAGGRWGAGWRGIKGRKIQDNCNSIINKMFFKKEKKLLLGNEGFPKRCPLSVRKSLPVQPAGSRGGGLQRKPHRPEKALHRKPSLPDRRHEPWRASGPRTATTSED